MYMRQRQASARVNGKSNSSLVVMIIITAALSGRSGRRCGELRRRDVQQRRFSDLVDDRRHTVVFGGAIAVLAEFCHGGIRLLLLLCLRVVRTSSDGLAESDQLAGQCPCLVAALEVPRYLGQVVQNCHEDDVGEAGDERRVRMRRLLRAHVAQERNEQAVGIDVQAVRLVEELLPRLAEGVVVHHGLHLKGQGEVVDDDRGLHLRVLDVRIEEARRVADEDALRRDEAFVVEEQQVGVGVGALAPRCGPQHLLECVNRRPSAAAPSIVRACARGASGALASSSDGLLHDRDGLREADLGGCDVAGHQVVDADVVEAGDAVDVVLLLLLLLRGNVARRRERCAPAGGSAARTRSHRHGCRR
mmetsp:Transcript_2753/g.7691  ORF Transcript_2753/g.7691 Transcript_2753/m.7691 type:complete len:361 (+) Transcript_2753:120-1202(+)